jgi:hypothetical protein
LRLLILGIVEVGLTMAYEFRFLNERGSMLLLYFTNCNGDAAARAHLNIAADLDYAKFEIWQDDRKVDSGRMHALAN